jgi:hypothetical protein
MKSSRQLTEQNLKLANEIADIIRNSAVGIFVTGSNAWGANYAVSKSSDIDLVVIIDSAVAALDIIKRLVEEDFVSKIELDRAEVFLKLQDQNLADVLSITEKTARGQLSLDMIPKTIANQIVNLRPVRKATCSDKQGTINLRVLREFRKNPPKVGGYTINDLKSKRELVYYPKFTMIDSGYLAESLIDSLDGSYYMGVFGFFFSIEPKIIVDNDSYLIAAIKLFQENIRGLVNGATVQVTREERMSDKVRNHIYQELR